MTDQDIQQMLGSYENTEIEFKSAKGGFPKAFWESYSSFANTNGGFIILGVKEKNNRFIPQPLSAEQVDECKKQFFDTQNNRSAVSLPLLSDKDVNAYEYGNGYILVFQIPRATREQRPI